MVVFCTAGSRKELFSSWESWRSELFDSLNSRPLITYHLFSRLLQYIGNGAYLARILNQSMLFGMSLSKIGVDFRGLLHPIFSKRIVELFDSHLHNTTSQFEGQLSRYKRQLAVHQGISSYSKTESRSNLRQELLIFWF